MLKFSPYILYSDGKGNIFEDTSLYTTGRSGWDAIPVDPEEWIELPEGGSLYELPGRRGIGIDVATGEMRLCLKGWAVAAFIPPAHTGLYLAAYETLPEAPTLPLFCYTAAGWQDNKFYVPAVRIEQDIRQDCAGYDYHRIIQLRCRPPATSLSPQPAGKTPGRKLLPHLSLPGRPQLFYGTMGVPGPYLPGL